MLRTTFFVTTTRIDPDTGEEIRGSYEIIRPARCPESAALFAFRYNGDPSKSGTIATFEGPDGDVYLVEDYMYLLDGVEAA